MIPGDAALVPLRTGTQLREGMPADAERYANPAMPEFAESLRGVGRRPGLIPCACSWGAGGRVPAPALAAFSASDDVTEWVN